MNLNSWRHSEWGRGTSRKTQDSVCCGTWGSSCGYSSGNEEVIPPPTPTSALPWQWDKLREQGLPTIRTHLSPWAQDASCSALC